ncbi:MAG: hypothetical protein IPJ88_16300 [Myxococcales bacterium]|nr:MAG: hypothetical protein IPJ88_16300 [Myxococcales bacterium]
MNFVCMGCCAVLLVACGDSEDLQVEQSVVEVSRGVKRAEPYRAAQPKQPKKHSSSSSPRRSGEESQPGKAPHFDFSEDEAEEKSSEKTEERDYEKELKQLVAAASSCVSSDIAKQATATVTLSVEATIMETGRVTRADVRSSSLPQEVTRCFEKQIVSGHFRAPVTNAPRTTRTSLTFQRKAKDN